MTKFEQLAKQKVNIEFTVTELNINLGALQFAIEAFKQKARDLEIKYNKATMLETRKQLRVQEDIDIIQTTISKYLAIEKKINEVMMA